MLIEGRVQRSPEGIVHLMASNIIDRSAMLDLLWRTGDAASPAQTKPSETAPPYPLDGSRRCPAGADPAAADRSRPCAAGGADARHTASPAIIPPPLHLAPPPRHRHPRQVRVLPKSRDFH